MKMAVYDVITFSKEEVLKSLALSQVEMIGKPLIELFPGQNGSLHEYCCLAISLGESIRLEMDIMEKTLLISIKPSFDEHENEVIIGTKIDITGAPLERSLTSRRKVFTR